MLRWTERAVADLIAIGDYIALDKPIAARSWAERLRELAVHASELPKAGRMVPEIAQHDVRERLLGSYRLVYRVIDDGIVVLTVFHGRRLLGELDTDADE